MEPPEGKKFYGSVTVSERGQIVIPADARRDFDIAAGDKLLVFGDLKAGLWITTIGIVGEMGFGADLIRAIGSGWRHGGSEAPETDDKTGT
ncbi:MAG: AbrB/MazE/SpoVT family DNA-binding domain-containing protein [Chloroflexota bacterium]|nr:AbrB/MazE/SpoVT family DNA-binding domain-containing protein [Chloroflexota bacterium]